ncbi:MAG: Gfo/Idh/MocA family oxidoreductase [Acidobacteriaceae bacterium]|nr:Gfo/Idh/MocA family oxidoreductase [Acidobacteriaceae bacterium]MBV9763264.1 Gfo/Idh/MocA family oxidoreductase [Acidobacteriaceae bacterium]
MNLDLNLNYATPKPLRADFGIGVVGAGFIMRDVQLKAYADAQFNVVAITSKTPEKAREVANLRSIPCVYETFDSMLRDPAVEILDIAVPPDRQLDLIRQAAQTGRHLKGILAQKPLAVNYDQAVEIVRICEERGIPLAVNQNMRYDQSIRALKTLLERGVLGEPVLATIEMRAVPHWQAWLQNYGRLTLLNMSIHHIDSFRYLFGDPESIFVSVRKDPRTHFAHEDGICLYILEYADGLRASAWDDVWAGPRTPQDDLKPYIKWRAEGTAGLAEGTIGWPTYPNRTPSTLTFTTLAQPGVWITPRWPEVWFPDAFQGPMADLMNAIATGTPSPIDGRHNLGTMAIVEAGYRSMRERRAVQISEIGIR